MSSNKSDARINVRLPAELKLTIEQAAAALGQSVSEFTVATMVQQARRVLESQHATRLSQRDGVRLLELLDELNAAPNAALTAAARRYGARHE